MVQRCNSLTFQPEQSGGQAFFFSSIKSLQKIEKLQEHALRFLYNDHKSSYNDLLLKSGRCTMQVSRQRSLCIEIYKTMNNLNPPFMKNFFKLKIFALFLQKG